MLQFTKPFVVVKNVKNETTEIDVLWFKSTFGKRIEILDVFFCLCCQDI